MKQNYSICPHCGCGCGLYLVSDEGRPSGITASQEHHFAQGQLCARGWTSYQLLAAEKAVRVPLYKKNGTKAEISWDKALEQAGKKLKAVKDKHGAKSIGVIASPRLTNQEALALRWFAREVLETPNADSGARFSAWPQEFPRPASYADLEKSDFIMVCGAPLLEENPILGARVMSLCKPEADRPYSSPDLDHVIPAKPAGLAVVDSRRSSLSDLAVPFLKAAPGSEAQVMAALLKMLIERHQLESKEAAFRKTKDSLAKQSWEALLAGTGVTVPAVEQLASRLASAKAPLMIAGRNLLLGQNPGLALTSVYGLSQLLSGKMPVLQALAGANDWGCARILNPEAGLGYGQMIKTLKAGELKALVLVGEDPLKTMGDREGTVKALQNAETVLVFDSFVSECHEYAEAVLPLLTSYQKEGSYYNLEGKLQEFKAAAAAESGALTLPEALKSMAQAMGVKALPKQEELPPLPPAGYEALSYSAGNADDEPYLLELGTAYPIFTGANS
jgi:predicted molibdopterin-dependent oxidoreductase YjgC